MSPESLRSKWVQEEYNRALVLANSPTGDLRIIPCLRGDLDIPGFLASRQWVDFRDQQSFKERVDDLCFGITGRRPAPGSVREAVWADPVTARDIRLIGGWIEDERKELAALMNVRIGASLLGFGAGFWSALGIEVPAALPTIGATIVMGLLGFSFTERRWSTCAQALKEMTNHREALEICLDERRPMCSAVVEAFNLLLKRRIGLRR